MFTASTPSVRSGNDMGPFQEIQGPHQHILEGTWLLSARGTVKLIAVLDIFYAMLLISLHLLTLITRQRYAAGRGDQTPGNSTVEQMTPASDLDLDLLQPTTTVPTPQSSISSQKSREIVEVLLWVAMFALCILQLLVAGALYGGTKQKEGRICIRNCRIWTYTASLLILVNLVQISWIFVEGKQKSDFIRLIVCITEICLRFIGIIAIQKLKQEIRDEQCDLEVMENDTVYYELQMTSPSPSPNKQANARRSSVQRPSKRHYHRTEVWDDLDFDQV